MIIAAEGVVYSTYICRANATYSCKTGIGRATDFLKLDAIERSLLTMRADPFPRIAEPGSLARVPNDLQLPLQNLYPLASRFGSLARPLYSGVSVDGSPPGTYH